MVKNGIAASSGIAIAKVLLLKEKKISISHQKTKTNDEIKQEKKRFDEAVITVTKKINHLITQTKAKIGAENAKIFEAHLEILNDPEIENQVSSLLHEQHYHADHAVETAFNHFYEMFKNLDDEYFRERATDILDVKNKLLKSILKIEDIDLTTINEEVIIVANDLTPTETSQLNPKFIKGFICETGSRTSHSAIMARTLAIPAIVGVKNITTDVKNDTIIAIDGNTGSIQIKLSEQDLQLWAKKASNWEHEQKELISLKGKPTITTDGITFKLEANIGSVKDVNQIADHDAQGVGLFRTEFLYMESDHLPTEEEQFHAYKAVLAATKNKVVIRTLDIGGDKELSYLKFPKELNPFLGYRAIRFCLDKKNIFKTQLRALLRASVHGKLAIMFPMIATLEEFLNAKKILLECKKELENEKIKVSDDFKIGMMIEIPVAAVNAQLFAKYADFFSIGTNDLIQYSMAADRMSEKVSYLYQPYHPAILKLIKMTIDGAKANKKKIPVAMCGEMAGDPIAIPLLVGLGLDEFSMSASQILSAKKIINNLSQKEMSQLATEALTCETNEQVIKLVTKKLKN